MSESAALGELTSATGAPSTSAGAFNTATGAGLRPIQAIVYANNAPAPGAKVLADLRADVSLRFSVPPGNVTMSTLDGRALGDEELSSMPIEAAPTRMMVTVTQLDGGTTSYETDLELNTAVLQNLPAASSSTSAAV